MLRNSAPAAYRALILAVLLLAPTSALADLRIHGEVGGLAPLDQTLRSNGSGVSLGGSIDYEVVDLLAIGAFYSFNDFITGAELNVFDHSAGVRLDLRYVRHRTAGWFGHDTGNAYGEAFIELDLAYHNLGNRNRLGWAIGLGYRVIVAGPFGFGPFFRFRHVVQSFDEEEADKGHQFYAIFGLEIFLSFDLSGSDEEDEAEAQPQRGQGGGGGGGDDEWDEFETVSSDSE